MYLDKRLPCFYLDKKEEIHFFLFLCFVILCFTQKCISFILKLQNKPIKFYALRFIVKITISN